MCQLVALLTSGASCSCACQHALRRVSCPDLARQDGMAMVAERSPVRTLTNTGYTAVVIVPSQTLAELSTPASRAGARKQSATSPGVPPSPETPPPLSLMMCPTPAAFSRWADAGVAAWPAVGLRTGDSKPVGATYIGRRRHAAEESQLAALTASAIKVDVNDCCTRLNVRSLLLQTD